jgi:DNA-directed RNA polymerase specialized sigma24 family protein
VDEGQGGEGGVADGRLAVVQQRAQPFEGARVVEMRVFGGLSVVESARLLGVSPETVTRDWRFARAWLQRELGK